MTYASTSRRLSATLRLAAAFPGVDLFVRARSPAEAAELRQAGATDVVNEATEAAVRFGALLGLEEATVAARLRASLAADMEDGSEDMGDITVDLAQPARATRNSVAAAVAAVEGGAAAAVSAAAMAVAEAFGDENAAADVVIADESGPRGASELSEALSEERLAELAEEMGASPDALRAMMRGRGRGTSGE